MKPAPLSPEEEIPRVRDLAARVKRSKAFQKRPTAHSRETIDALVRAFGTPDQNRALSNVRPGKVFELKTQLRHCFQNDRSFWLWNQEETKQDRPHQLILDLSAEKGLVLAPLSTAIDDSARRFWLHQLARYTGREHTLVTFSEPVFFFSASLRAYFRFLDIDYEGSLGEARATLVKRATRSLTQKMGAAGVSKVSIKAMVAALELSPVRHYVPAGDSYGASRIRSWFRQQIGSQPKRHEVSRGGEDELFTDHNRIILASRTSNRELEKFRAAARPFLIESGRRQLDLDLTYNGIRVHHKILRDEVTREGTRLARVVVTNWVFPKGAPAVTVVSSNHTRALGRVCEYLRNGELDANRFVENGIIPERMQLAFEVPLDAYDFRAYKPELIARVVYD